jgi:hypothetical protein
MFLVPEILQGQPLLEILSDFYWNITDFDGGIQMDNFSFQQVLQEVKFSYFQNKGTVSRFHKFWFAKTSGFVSSCLNFRKTKKIRVCHRPFQTTERVTCTFLLYIMLKEIFFLFSRCSTVSTWEVSLCGTWERTIRFEHIYYSSQDCCVHFTRRVI